MDILVSFVNDMLSKSVDVLIKEASYPFRVNKYVKELETEKDKLHSKIEGAVDRAKEAKKKTHKVVTDVETWLKEADSLMAKVVELQEEIKNRNKISCLKYCPNLVKRYRLAKQLEKKTNEITEHCQIDFPEFSRLATLVGMNYFSSGGFEHFDSRKGAYDELLDAIKDEEIHMIGLYGMGGCGKTTLAKQVGKEAEQFFDKVIFVTGSSTMDIRKIQGEIASQLGNLKLEEEGELGRARRLFMRLSSGERFLIILDDLWKIFEFENIGIPVVENKKSCTVLITTRKLDVCRGMNCKRMIPLEGLKKDEAWGLFQKHAGAFNDDLDPSTRLAQEIAKECGGLPVAIAAVASTLKGKPQVEWDEALKTLRDSTLMDIEEGLRNPYTCLRLSYDNLKNEVAKSLFLLCSIFPEDYEIPLDELTMIGVGLGLVKEVHSYQRARNQVITKGINKLIDSCLLLKAYKRNGHVKMHDLVRDVALWMAKKENKFIMGQLKEDVILKDSTVRYLWFDGVDKFPPKLHCPELEFLHVSTMSEQGVDVTDDFFKGMEKLKVLILESFYRMDTLSQLPISVHLINNLHCLFLCHWSLGDISFVVSLERLESLKLLGCSFDELPKSITQQRNLRLLDIRESKIQRNPYEVMGRCSQLEVLYFCENKVGDWKDQDKEDGTEFFDKISVTPTLESYCIDLGNYDYTFMQPEFSVTRSLYVRDHENCMSNATIKDLMQRAEVLYLRRIHRSCKSISPHVFQTIGGSMHALTQLSLLYSDTIECVIDTTNPLSQMGIISKLTHLTIKGMKNLKTVCRGQPPLGLFAKLEVLMIEKCDSIEHIITDEVKEIVANDNEDQRSNRFAFPKLKRLDIQECIQLEYLMPVSFAQSLAQLKDLNIWQADKLKSLFGELINGNSNPSKFEIIEFSSLTGLSLSSLPNLVRICPKNYHPTWPSLKRFRVCDVPELNINYINHWIARCGLRQEDDQIALEELLKAIVTPLQTLKSLVVRGNSELEVIFDVERLPNNGQQVNSSLDSLELIDLPELRHVCRGPKNLLLLQHLGELGIEKCGNLKVVFPPSILRSLPQLRQLNIKKCDGLEEIIGAEEEEEGNLIVFPNLTEIYIQQCHKLKHVFHISALCVLPKLKVLWIEEASELEQVFGDEKGKKIIERNQNNIIPNLEYAVLVKLPTLITESQWIDFQSVRYLVVQQCPKLTLTSTISPFELLQKYWSGKVKAEGIIKFWFMLVHIRNFNEDCSNKNTEQIDDKESEVEPKSESDHITSGAQNNEQKSAENGAKESKDQSAREANILEEKRVKEPEDQSAQEGNTSKDNGAKGRIEGSTTENAMIVTSSIHSEPISSLLVSSQEQIKGNQTEIDREDNPIIKIQDFEDNVGQSPIASVPVVATTKDELVAKAIADLEACLKMSLKNIATSEPNSLCLLTTLNFLSCLSFEDGDLSHGLKAVIQLLLQDFPSTLYCFKAAFATIKFMDEAHENEARLKEQMSMLEKEIQDCEGKISSVQEQKEKCINEIKEFKKEYESGRKEKSEMVEDQRKARQQLLEVYYRWSVLCSQFQQNHIDVRAHQVIQSVLEDNSGSNKNYNTETTEQIHSKELEVQAASDGGHLSSQVKINQSMLAIASPNLTNSVKEAEGQSVEEENISKENVEATLSTYSNTKLLNSPTFRFVQDVKGSIEGSTSDNTEIVISSAHSEPKQIKVNQTEADIDEDTQDNPIVKVQDFEDDELVAKAFVDLEVCLKMPLKDIATSEHYSLRILTALNFLSNLSFEDGALSPGLEAIIQSLLLSFLNILYSFKPAFATFNKFSRFVNEARDKEARLKEQISMMEKEIQECEAKLSSLQDKKKKCVAEAMELKKELDNVRKQRSEMVEHHGKAQQQMLEANHKWSALCSQFQLNIAARNLS